MGEKKETNKLMVAFQVVLAGLLVAIVVLALVQVFFRYIVEKNAKGVEELARLSVVWMSFLGGAYAYFNDKIITVDFLREKIKSAKVLKLLDLFILLCVLLVSFIMVFDGTKYVIRYWTYPDLSTSLLFPRSLFFLPIPLSGILFFAKGCVNVVRTLKGRTN
jgi:TRAP-type C4-dicarboxylate transport system permease small subunit